MQKSTGAPEAVNQAAERNRAERLSRFAPAAPEQVSFSEKPADVETVDWSRAGRLLWTVLKIVAWFKLGGAGAAGLRQVPWAKLASASGPMIETAIRERPVTRALRLLRSHPGWAVTVVVAVVAAGYLFSEPGLPPESEPFSAEPITDVQDYGADEFDIRDPARGAEVGPPVRTAAAFIDSGFIARRDGDEDAGLVRTAPFHTYDAQPSDVEHAGFEPPRTSANRGAWLTGTIEEFPAGPRAEFTH